MPGCARIVTMNQWLFATFSRLVTCLCRGVLLLPALALALDSDVEQPISIAADAAMVNETSGNSIYRGNVIITQGSLKVTSDEVEIFTADNQVIQIIARTDPDSSRLAHYQQQTNEAQDTVEAQARKITYLVQEERLHLAGSARLQQVQDVFTGELLYYDMGKGIVSLKSTGPTDRVNMTINPRKKSP